MKFSCLQENLVKSLQIINRAVPTRAAFPILSNVLIKTEDGRIKLAATNLSTTIITYMGASVDEDGTITVPAKLLKDYVSNLSPGTIEVKLKGNILDFKTEHSKSKFNGSSAEDYPDLPQIPEDSEMIELDPKDFTSTVALVAFASATDDLKPIYTGILVSYADEKLTVVSTDGFRLSEKVLNPKAKIEDFKAIIPAKTLLEVARIFSSSEQPIQMILNKSENQAIFKSEDTIVATRILDGQYPDYKRIIPEENSLQAIFETQPFIEAVKLTSIFAKDDKNRDETSTIKIRFDGEGKIVITSLRKQSGEHESELLAEINGETTEIAFNAKYLLEFLNNVKSEKICFTTNGNVAPCKFIPEGETDFLHIIMPMQI